jgi:hypothetical protein
MKRETKGKISFIRFHESSKILKLYSEKNIEKLKDHFYKLGISINSKWLEVEIVMKNDSFGS